MAGKRRAVNEARHNADFSLDIKLTSAAYDGVFQWKKFLNAAEYAIDRVWLV
jgi:hypothetical protein